MKTKEPKNTDTGTGPDMTKEQRAELKKLDAQEKRLTRQIEKIDVSVSRAIRAKDRAQVRYQKIAAQHAREFHRQTAVKLTKFARASAAETRALRKNLAAIERRRDIITGRLAS